MTDTLNCIELPQEVYDTIDESINNLKTKSLKEVKEFATDLDVKFNKNASIERMLDLIQVKLIDNAREEAADRAANAQHIAKVSGMSARERDLLHQAQKRARIEKSRETVIVDIKCLDSSFIPRTDQGTENLKNGGMRICVCNADSTKITRDIVPVDGKFAVPKLVAGVLKGIRSTQQVPIKEGGVKSQNKSTHGEPAFRITEVPNPEHYIKDAQNKLKSVAVSAAMSTVSGETITGRED